MGTVTQNRKGNYLTYKFAWSILQKKEKSDIKSLFFLLWTMLR